jgi:glycosyltransferase involved in cell wall biosynthesis
METLKFLMISTHFPPHHLGGDAVFVEYLSRALNGRGHDVHVLYNPGAYELLRKEKRATPEAGTDGEDVTRHPFESRFKRLNPVIALSLGVWGRAKDRLMELVKQLRPDVVHWHNARGFIGRPFPIEGAISLYTSHDYSAVCPRSNLLKPRMLLCEEPRLCTICCMRWGKPPQLWRMRSNRVMAFPPSLRVLSPTEFLARRYRLEGVAVHEILRNFVPDPGRDFRRDNSLNNSIMYLGMLERHKGVQTLLEAFSRSKDDHELELNIVGEGSLKNQLRQRAQQLGIADRVRIPGFLSREDLENLRKNAVAQVIPSEWYENAPLVALEGLSLGMPILASDIGGLPEYLGPESGSAIFKPGDADQLARLIVSTWELRNELGERRRKARAAYETNYTPEKHLAEYMRIIGEPR